MLAVKRHPEGVGERSSTIGNAYAGNLGHHKSVVPLSIDAKEAEVPLQPLFPCSDYYSSGSLPHLSHLLQASNLRTSGISSLSPHIRAGSKSLESVATGSLSCVPKLLC